MINPGTYENLGSELIDAGADLNNNIGTEYLKLNKKVIEAPENLIQSKDIFISAVSYYVLDFINFFGVDDGDDEEDKVKSDNIKDDDDNFILKAYRAGLDYADFFINNNSQKPTKTKANIVNGTHFLRPEDESAIIDELVNIPVSLVKFQEHVSFYQIIKESSKNKIKNIGIQVMRSTNDLYRQVASTVSLKEFQEGNIFTRRGFSQRLLNEFADNGVTGIVYRNGARHSITSYCEMLGRTLSGRTALQSSLNRFQERGYNLGIISSHFRCCPLCQPYEGATVSLDGLDDRYPSIYDAELQGLFHPNCKHSVSPFFEGYTPELVVSMDPKERELADRYGYESAQKIVYQAQERQRYIERKIRQYKTRELLSLSPVDKNLARKKVRQWQANQREHLERNTFLPRKYNREQI